MRGEGEPVDDLSYFTGLLEGAGLEYMVVGALAVAAHGSPRTSQDLDFAVELPRDRGNLVEGLLQKEGLSTSFARDEEGSRVVTVGPSGYAAEFWLAGDSEWNRGEFQRRVWVELAGRRFPFVSPEDLVLRKLVRHRMGWDSLALNDVRGVLEVQGEAFNAAFVREWCRTYRVCDLFEGLWAEVGREP